MHERLWLVSRLEIQPCNGQRRGRVVLRNTGFHSFSPQVSQLSLAHTSQRIAVLAVPAHDKSILDAEKFYDALADILVVRILCYALDALVEALIRARVKVRIMYCAACLRGVY